MEKHLPTLDVVTITTGVLVSDRGVAAIYETLGYVLQDPGLMTHQLPNAASAATPVLVHQHPWLADLRPPTGDLPALEAWTAALVRERGDALLVRAAEDGEADWVRGNAISDLFQVAEGKVIIVAVTPDPEPEQ